MTQIAFGMTQGPNGPQMTTMLIPTPMVPTPPQSYESHFESPEGVPVKVVYQTSDQTVANHIQQSLIEMMPSTWKHFEIPPATPATLWSKIGTAWSAAVGIPLVLGVAAFMLAFVAHMANYISFDDIETVIQWAAKLGLWSFPIIGIMGSAVAIFTHSSDKSNA